MDAHADLEDATGAQDDALVEALADGGSESGDDGASEASSVLEDMTKYDNVSQVSVLHSEELAKLLEKVEQWAEQDDKPAGDGSAPSAALTLGSELYLLMVDVNKMVQRLNSDLRRAFKFLTDHAEAYMPDLMQIEPNPVPYVKLLQLLRGRTDIAELREDLEDLPRKVKLPISTALHRAKPLSGEALERLMKGCEDLLELEAMRGALLEFVQMQMGKLAPNMVAVVGSSIAATLTCEAGGLDALARLPSNVLRSLGKVRRGVSSVSGRDTLHAGAVGGCALMQPVAGSELKVRRKAVAIIANKLTLAVRTDHSGGAPDGSAGRHLADEIKRLIDDLEKPRDIRKQDKALPKPGGKPGKSRRGGRKISKAREKWQMKDYEKKSNRVAFGQLQNEDFMDDGRETYRGQAASFKFTQVGEAPGAPPKKRKR